MNFEEYLAKLQKMAEDDQQRQEDKRHEDMR